MSHFTVMVVTPTEDMGAVERALQPFHEFECTGTDDEYVQEVDITEEAREGYAGCTDMVNVNLETGEQVSAFDDRFYREPTEEEIKKHGFRGGLGGTGCGGGISWTSRDWNDGKGYRTKVLDVPAGWERREVPTAKTFAEYVRDWHGIEPLAHGEKRGESHKYGYAQLDADGNVVKVIDRTNPNSKWDWWSVGGRWSGLLRTKSGEGVKGEPGVLGTQHSASGVDQARKGDLDIEAMVASQRRQAERTWEDYTSGESKPFLDQDWKEGISKEDYVAARMDGLEAGFSTFAVLMDGKWYERGNMGWWGIVTGEEDNWQGKFADLFALVPDDHTITIVDCHI